MELYSALKKNETIKMGRFENYCFFIKEKFEPEVHCVGERQLMSTRVETAITKHTRLLQNLPSPL